MRFAEDIRSKRVSFLAFCLLCQAFQARGIVRKFPAIVTPVLELLERKQVNVIQMPCPEGLFGGLEVGLRRQPKSYRRYDTPDFREHCANLAQGVVETACSLVECGLIVTTIVGVEYSPSCAVSYQYEGRTVHRRGIFMQELEKGLERVDLDVPFIGVTRRGVRPALRHLHEVLGDMNDR